MPFVAGLTASAVLHYTMLHKAKNVEEATM